MLTDTIELFAGPGGWSTGRQMLKGITTSAVGVEWDEHACRTATAAGHRRIGPGPSGDVSLLNPRDVAAAAIDDVLRGLIASPPCQGFSMAGAGLGRGDVHLILEALELIKLGIDVDFVIFDLARKCQDERSALVLEPLRWVLDLSPEWTAWEQVPAVLPLWKACADVLRSRGYSVWTGNLQAECYGVPQTRKRAILIASRVRPVVVPVATHSRFHSRDPHRLDAGVLPWVSMAQALGWGMTERPAMTVTGGGSTTGGAEPFGNMVRQGMLREVDAGHWRFAGAGVTSEVTAGQVPREMDQPAHTNTGKGGAASNYSTGGAPGETAEDRGRTVRTLDQPSVAVTSKGFHWLASGTRDRAAIRRGDQPAPTIAPGHDSASMTWVPEGTEATQVAGLKAEGTAIRVTVAEAAVLQTFPPDYPFTGNKGERYRQIGDAVPPLLAAHVLAAAGAGVMPG